MFLLLTLTAPADRGSHFESMFFLLISNWLETKHSRTIAYHAQTFGMIEWLHLKLEFALMARANTVRWREMVR